MSNPKWLLTVKYLHSNEKEKSLNSLTYVSNLRSEKKKCKLGINQVAVK